jgi:hypothetical protein
MKSSVEWQEYIEEAFGASKEMNTELKAKVLPIAKRVREWTERKAERARYNQHNLCGWCAISAAQLFRELRRENIDAELHYVSGHCFVVVNDYIVDVTATQFSKFENVEINIIHYKMAKETYWYYDTEKTFDTPTKLREHQIKKDWPQREICYTR